MIKLEREIKKVQMKENADRRRRAKVLELKVDDVVLMSRGKSINFQRRLIQLK